MIDVPAATGGKIISTVKDPVANVPAPGFILWNPVDFVPPPASLPKRVFILPERIKRKRGVAKIVNSKKLDRNSICRILYERREDRMVIHEEQRVHDLHLTPARVDPDLPQGG